MRMTTAGLLVMVVAACGSAPRAPEPPSQPPSRTVAVEDVAHRLGLSVLSSSDRGAVLGDGANSVSLFPDPQGRAYVNGQPVGPVGGIVGEHGALRITENHLAAIRSAMIPRPVVAPPDPVPDEARPRPGGGAASGRLGRVVIDPGHGGEDTGTPRLGDRRVPGNGIIDEKVVNLDTGLRLERLLAQGGAEVVMTRRRDTTVQLDQRPDFGNRLKPRLFVSLHADAAENRSAHGFTVYVARQASAASLRAAEAIRREMARTGVTDRGIRRADYRVLKNSVGPAVLVELGFLSNPAEARRLATSSHREALAAAVARGVLSFLKM